MLSRLLMVLMLAMIFVACSSVEKTDSEPAWTKDTLTATGIGHAENTGNPAQAKFMGERASQIRALESLKEKICNLPVDDQTLVGNVLPADWKISGFNVDSVQCLNDGSYQTIVSIPLSYVWSQVQTYRK